MTRSSAAAVLTVFASFAFVGACTFAPPAGGGAAASSGGPLGSGASSGSGTGLIGGGGAQTGQGNNSGMNCATVNQPVSKLPPDILLIQDKSSSMGNDDSDQSCQGGCGANSKWSQLTSALTAVLSQTDTAVNWGIKFFSDNGACNASAAPAVPIGPMHAAMITAAVNGTAPGGNTPTRNAVTNGAQYMVSVNDQNPKFLLLATDGLPNCPSGCAGMSRPSSNCTMTDNPAEDQAAEQAVADAAAMGFRTFVVGIGNVTVAQNTLNAMAMAGGVPQMGVATSYYAATDQAALESALTAIVGVANTCIFTIPPPPNNSTDQTHIGVQVNGVDLKQDRSHANGWDFAGTGQVQVYGPSCDAIMAGTATVAIVFKCIIG